MYLQRFSKIRYFCLNHNKQECLFMSHALSVYDLCIPAGRKTEIWTPILSDMDFKLCIITVTAANWHPEVQYRGMTIKQLCFCVSLNWSCGHKEKAFKWLLSTSGWMKMKTYNKYFPISWYQCWCPPFKLYDYADADRQSSEVGILYGNCADAPPIWRGYKCRNISAPMYSYSLTKSQPTEENHRLPHQPRYPKQKWHSKRHLLLLTASERTLELTGVLTVTGLWFCRDGQFPSLCK